MEVIATKFQRKSTFILILIASVAVLAAGLILFFVYASMPDWDEDVYMYIALVLIAIGIAVTVMSVIGAARYFRLPQVLITYENGELTLPKGVKIQAYDVVHIDYATATPSYKDITVDMGFGMITIITADKKYKVKYTAETLKVYDRLNTVVKEARLSR